jgi:hypothetical protein
VQKDAAKAWEHLPGFNTDSLQKYGGEKNLSVKAGDVVKLSKGSVVWKYDQSPDSIVDLVASISKYFPVFAYAYTEVEAADAGVQMIGIGSNDGVKLLVNGADCFDYPAARPVKIDGNLVPVFLKKGKNTILLKIEQHGNKWGFCLRFHDFSPEEALERGDLFREAIKVADNEELLQRVEMCSLPILYLKCRRTPVLARQDGTYADFCRIAKRENVTFYSEAGEADRKAFHSYVENAK